MARIACCQLASGVDDPAANLSAITDAIGDAAGRGAQVILLPELATSGYVFQSAEEARDRAMAADALDGLVAGPGTREALAICGFCELAADGRVFNSVALIDADGVQAVYRKLHLWDRERLWFTPGEHPAPVIETRYGRIGLAICYDIEFPELTRGLALGGAELIALPANWPLHADPPDGRPILHSIALTTAYLDKLFLAVCDRCGTERGLAFEGGSVIAGPDGRLIAVPVGRHDAEIIVADCDLLRARDKRLGAGNDAFADRRAEHYVSR